MTPEQLHILQHSLGLDAYGRGTRYRSHFVTGFGSVDYPHCLALVEAGLMTGAAGGALTGGDDIFFVTSAGVDAVSKHSPAPPKLSKSKQRYRDFLALDSSMTFGEYIKWKERERRGFAATDRERLYMEGYL